MSLLVPPFPLEGHHHPSPAFIVSAEPQKETLQAYTVSNSYPPSKMTESGFSPQPIFCQQESAQDLFGERSTWTHFLLENRIP